MTEQTNVDTEVGIKVVLNGGKSEMDSASIPIEWWFSDEVIAKQPSHILLFEQDGSEKEGGAHLTKGRRYLLKVSDNTVKFIQLFSSGYHRAMVIVLAGHHAQYIADDLMSHSSSGEYTSTLNWKDATDNTLKGKRTTDYAVIVASTVEEFEVPAELFAKPPETRFQKAVSWWANLWATPWFDEPKDECSYGKRKLFAITIQPPLALVYYSIKHFIVGTFHALYVLVASIVMFFIGFGVYNVPMEMGRAFIFTRHGDWWNVKSGTDYRQLWRNGPTFPVSPLELTFLAGFVYSGYLVVGGVISLGISLWLMLGTIAISAVVFLLLLLVAERLLDRFNPYSGLSRSWTTSQRRRREVAAQEKALALERAEKELLEWYAQFNLSNMTDEVNLARLPDPRGFKAKIIQKFYVTFWAKKAAVCKPYSK